MQLEQPVQFEHQLHDEQSPHDPAGQLSPTQGSSPLSALTVVSTAFVSNDSTRSESKLSESFEFTMNSSLHGGRDTLSIHSQPPCLIHHRTLEVVSSEAWCGCGLSRASPCNAVPHAHCDSISVRSA